MHNISLTNTNTLPPICSIYLTPSTYQSKKSKLIYNLYNIAHTKEEILSKEKRLPWYWKNTFSMSKYWIKIYCQLVYDADVLSLSNIYFFIAFIVRLLL